jgi:hypothetical protein
VREQEAIGTYSPHIKVYFVLCFDFPCLELFRNVVVKLESRAKTGTFLSLEFKL